MPESTNRTARAYVCNTWKSLQIGRHVKFQDGFFETDDPELQNEIEKNNAFGIAIHYQDTLEVMEARGRELSEQRAAEKARRRQELLDELAAEDRDERARLAKLAEEQEQREGKRRAEATLRAADEVAQREIEKARKAAEDKAAAEDKTAAEKKVADAKVGSAADKPNAPAFGGIVTADSKKKN